MKSVIIRHPLLAPTLTYSLADCTLRLLVLNVIPLTCFLNPRPALSLVFLLLENEKFLCWQKERDDLKLNLETETITEKDIQQIREFALHIAERLESESETCDDRRRVIELLDVGALLTVEDGQKFIDIWCFLGRIKLSIGSHTFQNAVRASDCLCCSARIRHQPHRTCRRVPWLVGSAGLI